MPPTELKCFPEALNQAEEGWDKRRTLNMWIEAVDYEYEAASKRALEEDRTARFGRAFAL